jgi:MFS family permease
LASRLPREARLFGAVSLFNDVASEMVYPLLPALLKRLGGGAVALGALDGAADFASSVVKLVAGRWADRPARRGPLVVIGYGIALLVRPLIALAQMIPQVIVLRVTDRLGKGVRTPPRDAIIADATPLELRGRAFGLQRALDNLGSVLGPIVAWALLASGTLDVAGVIAASIVPGIIVLVLAVLATRTSQTGDWPASAAEAGVPAGASRPTIDRLPLPVALIALFALIRMPEALLILRAQELGVPVAAVTLLWAAVSLAKAAGSFAGGTAGDRWSVPRSIGLGWTGYAVLVGAFALARVPWHAWLLFPAVGLAAGFVEAPERALVARLGAGRQGSAFGAYHAAQGFAALAGGLALGLVYQRAGAAVALVASAVGTATLRVAWIRASRGA